MKYPWSGNVYFCENSFLKKSLVPPTKDNIRLSNINIYLLASKIRESTPLSQFCFGYLWYRDKIRL